MAEIIGGRWELLEPFASGSTSTVWRALDRKLGVECAAKVLRQRDAGNLLRFAREQSRRLVHPHIVAPYAWAADDGTVLIASELVSGGSLRTFMGDNGPLSEGTVTVVLDQLLDALAAVHAAQIVHRDVNPGNVLLRATEDGTIDVALVDFGIALAEADARLTVAGTVIGTPGYVAPDLLDGTASPDASHDLYAAGRLAGALILGHESGTVSEAVAATRDPVLAQVLARLGGGYDARPRATAEVVRMLQSATRDPEPRDRDGDPVTVFDQLDAADETAESHRTTRVAPAEPAVAVAETVELPRDAPQSEARPRSSRARWMVGAGAAILLALAALATASQLWLGGGEQDDPAQSPSGPPGTVTDTPGNTGTDPSDVPQAGDACTWQEEGDVAEVADLTLVCTLEGGQFVWLVQ